MGNQAVRTLKGEIDEEGQTLPLLKRDPKTEKTVSFHPQESSNDESHQDVEPGVDDSRIAVYDPDKKIWDQWEINQINKEGSGHPKLPYVKRLGTRQQFGIRANRKLDFTDCFFSIFWPTQNEFLPILIYLGFALYFWISVFLISQEVGIYGTLRDDNSILQIFFVTFSIAISLSITACFFIFYARDFVTKLTLQSLHYVGILLMVYTIAFVFALSEFRIVKEMELILLTLGLSFIVCVALIFTFNSLNRNIAWGLTVLLLTALLIYDFNHIAGKRQK